MTTLIPAATGKPRPAIFRALGNAEPPAEIEVAGVLFKLQTIFKHDSWAATALYAAGKRQIVCKFNRQQSIFGLPMAWLGRLLARREAWFFRTLADLPAIPATFGPVRAAGRILPHAVAHEYIAGHALRPYESIPKAFLNQLDEIVAELHRRGIAYMDLHKRENVIRGDDGLPYLLDFQVSLYISPRTWFLPLRWLLAALQNGDRYSLMKHRVHYFPLETDHEATNAARPWWIRLHRLIAVPFRTFRRALLVRLGIRKGIGAAQSEHFVEDGLRTGK